MYSVAHVLEAIVLLSILLVIGRVMRRYLPPLRWIFLPSSVIAGFLGLLLGPQVLGALLSDVVAPESFFAGGLFPQRVVDIWYDLPALLISVVFATLFLGRHIPGLRYIWGLAGPQAAFGQILAWGQYIIGILLAMLVLKPFFGTNPLAGALIEIGFQGGHGTAAGLSSTFDELGFAQGRALALGLATIGVLMAVIIGTIIIQWGRYTGQLSPDKKPYRQRPDVSDEARGASGQKQDVVHSEEEKRALEPLSLHIGLVAAAVALGWLILQGLIWLEDQTWGSRLGFQIFQYVPLFPLAMLGGVIVQLALEHIGGRAFVDRQLMSRISGAALDLTIAAAIAALSLTVLRQNLWTLLILAGAGIAWNVTAFFLLAPKIIPSHWFERGIGDLGQSMGMTVTGLLLMRMADPGNRSGAVEAFGYKQLLFEPIVGGGLFTAAAMPLIAQLGPWVVLGITAALLIAWLAVARVFFWQKGRGIAGRH